MPLIVQEPRTSGVFCIRGMSFFAAFSPFESHPGMTVVGR